MNIDYEDIGKRVRIRRKSLGISQERLACSCGVTVSYLSQIETGRKLTSLAFLIELSDKLKCSMDWLVFGRFPDAPEGLRYDFNECAGTLTGDEQDYIYGLLTHGVEFLHRHR